MALTSNMLINVVANVTGAKHALDDLDRSVSGLGGRFTELGNLGDAGLFKLGGSLQKVGDVMSSVGSSMTQFLTLPILGVGAAAIKTMVDFETAFTGVKKTVDENNDVTKGAITNYDVLERKIREIATTLGLPKEEIAGIMQMAGQLGVRGNEALGSFTETVAKLTITTGESSEYIAMMIGKMAAISGLNIADDVTKLGSVITALGNTTATTERDIMRFGVRASAAGTLLGMSLPDILAVSAAYESTGTKAERGGTAFTKIMLAIQGEAAKGTEDVKKFTDQISKNNKEVDKWTKVLNEAQAEQKRLSSSGSASQEELQKLADTIATAQENLAIYKDTNEGLSVAIKASSNAQGGFAKLLGMTDKEFQNMARSTDGATTLFTKLVDTIGHLGREGKDVQGIMKDLGLSDARLVQSMLSLAQAETELVASSSSLSEAVLTARAAWIESTGDFANAMDEEVIRRMNTIEAQWGVFKELIKETFLILTDGEKGALQDFVKDINVWLLEFNARLREIPKEDIRKFIDMMLKLAAAGPLLWAVGKAVGFIGGAFKTWAFIQGAMTAMTKWATLTEVTVKTTKASMAAVTKTVPVATTQLTGMTAVVAKIATGFVTLGDKILLSFGVITGSVGVSALVALGAVVAAVGLIVLAFEGLKYAAKQAYEPFDLLDGVSKKTEQALQPFVDKYKEIDRIVTESTWQEKIITDKDVQTIKAKVSEMSNNIINELDAGKNKNLAAMDSLSNYMTPEKYGTVLSRVEMFYTKQETMVRSAESRIQEIYETAFAEKRSITEEELAEIQHLNKMSMDVAVVELSANERDLIAIRTRLRSQSTQISRDTAMDIIKDAIKTKNESILAAEEQYNLVLAQAQKMLDVGAITQQEYDDIVEAANKAKKDSIQSAEDQFNGILTEAKKAFPDILKYIDTQTGEMTNKLTVAFINIAEFFTNLFSGMGKWLDNLFNKKPPKSIAPPAVSSGSGGNSGNVSGMPTVSLYAKGGTPKEGEIFQAGEDGVETIGKYKGKPTVMPLENTSFVDAMYGAVRSAVSSAMGSLRIEVPDMNQGSQDNSDIASAIQNAVKAIGISTTVTGGEVVINSQRENGGDDDRLVNALVTALERAGIGATYLDGKLVTQALSPQMAMSLRRDRGW